MVTNVQFAAVAAYLLWCLFSALTGLFDPHEIAGEPAEEINESDRKDQIATAR